MTESDESGEQIENVVVAADVSNILPRNKGAFRTRYKWNNIQYTTNKRHLGNSQILFLAQDSPDPIPAVIEYIHVADGRDSFVIRRHLAKQAICDDAFSRYANFPAKIYSADFSDLEIIEPRAVKCHFASFRIDPSSIVVLSLSKVRTIRLTTFCTILNFRQEKL